ncbi:reverse transcriptase domain-containing protein [Tanacetum coccineum]
MSVRLAGRSFQYPVGIAENMLVEVEDFDALLDEGSKILHSIKGTILEEEIFSEFDKFIAMAANENYDSESDEEEPKFEKITINTDYKIKTSLEEPPTDLELKPLPDNLEYVFLEEPFFLLVIISSQLSAQNKSKLIELLDDKKPVVQKQRRLNPNMQEVVKKEIVKLLDTGIIYLIADSPWVSPIHCVPKKGGITVVTNENDELVPTRTITGWQVCIDYRKLNEETAKDHFPLPFMDQILETLTGNKYFCFLDGFSGYFQIPIDPMDQEKTTFTCPLVHTLIGEYLSDYVMLHVHSKGLEVDKAKIDVISKLPPPTNIKGVRSFLGHAGFYRRFIKDFSKVSRPRTKLLEKDTLFEFDDECRKAFELLKEKLTCAPVIVSLNWNLPFELMCDASDFAVGAVKIVSLQVMSKDEYVSKKCSSQEVSKIISRRKIKISSLKFKDIKSKIMIQDHKHAKETSKEFPSIQGSKIQDVTRSEAIKLVEIMDREIKQLKQSRVPIIKVQWNSKRGPEFTWEREDQFRSKYPHLFPSTTPEGNSS